MEKKKADAEITTYTFDIPWEKLMDDGSFIEVFLSDVLENYVQQQRWYGGKSSSLKYIELQEYFRIQQREEVYYGLLLEVNRSGFFR